MILPSLTQTTICIPTPYHKGGLINIGGTCCLPSTNSFSSLHWHFLPASLALVNSGQQAEQSCCCGLMRFVCILTGDFAGFLPAKHDPCGSPPSENRGPSVTVTCRAFSNRQAVQQPYIHAQEAGFRLEFRRSRIALFPKFIPLFVANSGLTV